jgi:hypothetical protein
MTLPVKNMLERLESEAPLLWKIMRGAETACGRTLATALSEDAERIGRFLEGAYEVHYFCKQPDQVAYPRIAGVRCHRAGGQQALQIFTCESSADEATWQKTESAGRFSEDTSLKSTRIVFNGQMSSHHITTTLPPDNHDLSRP